MNQLPDSDWMKALASELTQRKYRTLCEAEVLDIIRRYARSEGCQSDSEEPVDHAWLESIGGRRELHPQKVTFDRDGALSIGLWLVDDGWKAMLLLTEYSSSCIVRGLTTRGKVRMFADLFGIQIQEAAR